MWPHHAVCLSRRNENLKTKTPERTKQLDENQHQYSCCQKNIRKQDYKSHCDTLCMVVEKIRAHTQCA